MTLETVITVPDNHSPTPANNEVGWTVLDLGQALAHATYQGEYHFPLWKILIMAIQGYS